MERVSLQRQRLVVTEELMNYVDKHLSSNMAKEILYISNIIILWYFYNYKENNFT